jgi:trimethylamine--corrinoid protein Co-methyltransferase
MGCPVVSPLRFGTENLEVVMRCAELGLAYDIAVAPQAGATSPAALAGSLVQVLAETLATLAVVQMVNPASPFMMGHWPFISDLRTGSFTGGSGEQALVSAAVSQLCNYLGLPSSSAACMSDSKLPDNQAGYEKGITATLLAHSGCNYINEAFGMLGSLMACSYEAMIIDNDMVGSVLRTVRGIEVSEDTLSLEVIRETVFGSGHFLNSAQTLSLMETEYLYPSLADRQSYGLWEQQGKKDSFERAHERAQKLLGHYYPSYITQKADALIRQHFPIMLKPEEMQPGNGRW